MRFIETLPKHLVSHSNSKNDNNIHSGNSNKSNIDDDMSRDMKNAIVFRIMHSNENYAAIHAHKQIHVYTYMYMYIYVCTSMCVLHTYMHMERPLKHGLRQAITSAL